MEIGRETASMTGVSGDELVILVKARDLCENHSETSVYAKMAYKALLDFMHRLYLNEPDD